MKKIYTAFISSAFTSLRKARSMVIDSLLDFRVLPVSMEHFTVSTSGEFSDIEELIDDSDFFIMLMGKRYGSCDENGVSWTEREFNYAMLKNKPVIVIVCDELAENLEKPLSELTEDEQRQVEFRNRITFARVETNDFPIKTILSQFFNTYNFSKCIGWTRVESPAKNEADLLIWQKEHSVFDLSGLWYHVHLSEDSEKYIRIGTVKIEQDFSPETYKSIHMDGENYNIYYYDSASSSFKENKMKYSRFTGEYTLQENGEIFGIYNSKRAFSDDFNGVKVSKGPHRGIHDFTLDVSATVATYLEGEFHDEAPSPKQGRIFLFRDINERNEFVLDNCFDLIERR